MNVDKLTLQIALMKIQGYSTREIAHSLNITERKRKMTKTIFEEMGGTYRQVGDYLLPNITVPAEEEIEPIGLWGKRHARHLKEHYKVLYMNLLTSGKLHSYLAEVDKQAEDMFLRLVKEYADRQDVTEQLKKDNPYEWIGRMNNIQACVREVVGTELIYT